MSLKTRAAQAIAGNFYESGLAGLSGDDDNAQMLLVRTLVKELDRGGRSTKAEQVAAV